MSILKEEEFVRCSDCFRVMDGVTFCQTVSTHMVSGKNVRVRCPHILCEYCPNCTIKINQLKREIRLEKHQNPENCVRLKKRLEDEAGIVYDV